MPLVAEVIDADKLLQTVWVSLAAGVGIALAFSLVVLGATRAPERWEQGREIVAGLYAALGVLGLVVSGAGIVLGLVAMTNK